MHATDAIQLDEILQPVGYSNLAIQINGVPVGSLDALVADLEDEGKKGGVDIKLTHLSSKRAVLASRCHIDWARRAKRVLHGVADEHPGHALLDLDFIAWVVYLQPEDRVVVLKATCADLRQWGVDEEDGAQGDVGNDDDPPRMCWVEPAGGAMELEIGDGQSSMTRLQKLAQLKAAWIKDKGKPNETWERHGEPMIPISKETAAIMLGRAAHQNTLIVLQKRLAQTGCTIRGGASWTKCSGLIL